MDELMVISGDGQQVEQGQEFSSLSVMARSDGAAAGGRMVSFFVDDQEGTGTDFHGGSPVRVTTASDGVGTTDVPLIAGGSPGAVQIKVLADGASTTLSVEVTPGTEGAHVQRP